MGHYPKPKIWKPVWSLWHVVTTTCCPKQTGFQELFLTSFLYTGQLFFFFYFSIFSSTFRRRKSWAIVVTPASGSVKFFVHWVHFSKAIKGIHLKLGILVHYQKRNQLQQGRWPCDLYIQNYLPLFRHST